MYPGYGQQQPTDYAQQQLMLKQQAQQLAAQRIQEQQQRLAYEQDVNAQRMQGMQAPSMQGLDLGSIVSILNLLGTLNRGGPTAQQLKQRQVIQQNQEEQKEEEEETKESNEKKPTERRGELAKIRELDRKNMDQEILNWQENQKAIEAATEFDMKEKAALLAHYRQTAPTTVGDVKRADIKIDEAYQHYKAWAKQVSSNNSLLAEDPFKVIGTEAGGMDEDTRKVFLAYVTQSKNADGSFNPTAGGTLYREQKGKLKQAELGAAQEAKANPTSEATMTRIDKLQDELDVQTKQLRESRTIGWEKEKKRLEDKYGFSKETGDSIGEQRYKKQFAEADVASQTPSVGYIVGADGKMYTIPSASDTTARKNEMMKNPPSYQMKPGQTNEEGYAASQKLFKHRDLINAYIKQGYDPYAATKKAAHDKKNEQLYLKNQNDIRRNNQNKVSDSPKTTEVKTTQVQPNILGGSPSPSTRVPKEEPLPPIPGFFTGISSAATDLYSAAGSLFNSDVQSLFKKDTP